MIMYHASTVKIKDFYIPYGGLHVGGLHSALEAALRKVRSYDGEDVLQVFVHRVEVDVGRYTRVDDMGDCDGWRYAMNAAQRDNLNSLEYKNEFEPDIVSSYVLWEPERIKVIDIDVMSQDEAEDIINEFYESMHG